MADDRGPSPWPTLVILGVLCGLAIGAIFVLFGDRPRRRRELGRGDSRDLDLDFDDDLLSDGFLGRGSVRGKGTSLTSWGGGILGPVQSRPIARTVRVSSREPTMLLQAVGTRDWIVWVRVTGPPGSSAVFLIGATTGDAIRVPSGSPQEMRLPRGEMLFAQGNVAGVEVSVSGGEK